MMLMTIDVAMGKHKVNLPLGLSYLISPGNRDSADASVVRSERLLDTYETSPSANMMMPVVSRNVII